MNEEFTKAMSAIISDAEKIVTEGLQSGWDYHRVSTEMTDWFDIDSRFEHVSEETAGVANGIYGAWLRGILFCLQRNITT